MMAPSIRCRSAFTMKKHDRSVPCSVKVTFCCRSRCLSPAETPVRINAILEGKVTPLTSSARTPVDITALPSSVLPMDGCPTDMETRLAGRSPNEIVEHIRSSLHVIGHELPATRWSTPPITPPELVEPRGGDILAGR